MESPASIKHEADEDHSLNGSIVNDTNITVKAELSDDSPLSSPILSPEDPFQIKNDPATTSQSMSDIPQLESKTTLGSETGVDEGEDAASEQEYQQTEHLQQLVHHQSPEVLELGVRSAIDLLDQLKIPLEKLGEESVDIWLENIKDLKRRVNPPRTVVGVVGNTGAGKSSVINALLDEERLLPTNCLRACTASPTEISYNDSTDPAELYRAEIEFISKEEWIGELKILFADLLDGNGQVSREATLGDSDAAVAYAKLKAVYPSKTREMLAEGSPESFADEPAVRGILSSVKKLKENSAQKLYEGLQHYVDSKEKATGTDHRKPVNVAMEYWPLIKVVRIYTKADALSTGAVIVDLPGVQDSNAARAAVAANYQKSCTGLWIVAPITRVVDDKTAKTLLGNSFKRQLKYDGTYSAVSFICSKTDDISITEAAESLQLEDEISESWSQSEALRKEKETLGKKIQELRGTKDAYGGALDECEAKLDIWEDLQEKLDAGEVVYAPSDTSNKRKRSEKPLGSRKNMESGDNDDNDDVDFGSVSSDKENSQPNEDRQPLDSDAIDKMLASLKSERKRIRDARRALNSEMAGIRKEIDRVQAEREELLAESKAICIKGRNKYSTEAIRHDFAMGIKELDQENAAEEDDSTFDPDQDIRDYDEVASSLPVFCVSSRAYQKLRGRLCKDDFQSHGYMTVEDTEVPQLQAHAKKLTEAGRASHCRRFLNDLVQLVNSMKLWATSDSNQSSLSGTEKKREAMHLRKLLGDLEKGLDSSVEESVTLLHASLQEHIYEAFDNSIPQAVNSAVGTAEGWGAHRSLGGMYWATYKATVRRNGVFHGASGARDFNAELFEPISRNLATGWERAFQRRVPAVLSSFATKSKKLLAEFHEAARARAVQRGTNVGSLYTLGNQMLAHIRTLEDLPALLRDTITELQREASRQFTPVIMEAMADAYEACTDERGPGQYNRMKTIVVTHVDETRHTMFRDATDTVKAQLDTMCRDVKKQLTDRVEGIFDVVFREYMNVIVGTKVDRHVKLSPEEIATRANVNDILQRGDSMFAFPESGENNGPEAGQGVVETNGPQPETEPQLEPAPANISEHQTEGAELETECHGLTAPNKPGQDSDPIPRSETPPVEAGTIQSQLDEMLQQEIREMSERL